MAGQRRFEFGILGPLETRSDGVSLELRRAKERTLLGMLLLRAGDVVTLDHLATGLWEDLEARPPATLRVHVSRLRSALAGAGAVAEQMLVTAARGYKLEVPADAIDAHRFERLAAEGRRLSMQDPEAAADAFAAALALWRGPVLSDLSISAVSEPELVRLEEARLAAIEDRIDADLRCGRHHELIGRLEQLVAEHPFRERLWGQEMVALYRGGRQADALRRYEDLRILLREELGITPSPALQQLERAILDHDAILGAPTAVAGPPREMGTSRTATPPRLPNRLVPLGLIRLSGRRPQLDSLLEAWKACASGDRRVVLVSGEAGIGKTRLAAEVAHRVYDGGGVVLFGRCDEDIGVPFQPFAEALEHFVQAEPVAERLGRHAGELVRLVPDLARRVPGIDPPLQADPESELYRLFDSVAAWLGTISRDAGVLLVLDDLHWAGKPTLMLLRHLARTTEAMRVLIVGTYRDTDIGTAHPLADALADLRREACVARINLGGLDVSEVHEMFEDAGGERMDVHAASLGDAVWSETNGNPFFVQEILRSLLESESLVRRQGVLTTDGAFDRRAIPEGVREVVGRRLSRLGGEANKVLALASVIGEVIDFDVLVRAGDLGDEVVLDALDEATGASLLRETSSGAFEFTHAIVRSTLYGGLSEPRRARRHRQVAEALEALGGRDPAALAHHFGLAGGADLRAVDYAALAGGLAIDRLAFDRAADFYSRALVAADRVEIPPGRRVELLIGLGRAQRLAAIPAYRETLLAAAALALDTGETELLATAVLNNSRGFASAAGAVDRDRVRYIEAALAAGGSADSATRARLLSLLALEVMWEDPDHRRLGLADEALAMARRLGDDACLLDVCMATQVACSVPDRVPALVHDLPELVAVAERVGDVQQLASVCFGGAVHYLEMDELRGAATLTERLGTLVVEINNPLFRWMDAHQRCRALSVGGSGDDLEVAALEALQIGQDIGQPDPVVWFAPQLFVARWAQGRLGETVDLIRGAIRQNPGLSAWRATLALALSTVGEREEGAALVGELMADPARALPTDIVWLTGHSVLAEAVAAVGTAQQATAEYALLAPYAGRVPCLFNVARPAVSLWLGDLAVRAGWPERAEQHFADALTQHRRMGAPLWLARTQLDCGRLLLATDVGRARDVLAQAREGAERLGGAAVASASAELLATLG